MTTVVGYVRPSRAAGSISPQLTQYVREAAARQNLDVAGIYTDAPPNSAGGGDRRGLMTAVADVREGLADGLFLLSLRHLSTVPDARRSLLRMVTSTGGAVYVSGTGPVDSNGTRHEHPTDADNEPTKNDEIPDGTPPTGPADFMQHGRLALVGS